MLVAVAVLSSGCLASMLLSKKTKHDWIFGTGKSHSKPAWDIAVDVNPSLLSVTEEPHQITIQGSAAKNGWYEQFELKILLATDGLKASQRADSGYQALNDGEGTRTSPEGSKLLGLPARRYALRVEKAGDMGKWGTTSHWFVADLGKCRIELYTKSNRHGANHLALDEAVAKHIRGLKGKRPDPVACR